MSAMVKASWQGTRESATDPLMAEGVHSGLQRTRCGGLVMVVKATRRGQRHVNRLGLDDRSRSQRSTTRATISAITTISYIYLPHSHWDSGRKLGTCRLSMDLHLLLDQEQQNKQHEQSEESPQTRGYWRKITTLTYPDNRSGPKACVSLVAPGGCCAAA